MAFDRRFIYLKEFVYGGIDGCVTTFAVVAGATGANLSSGIILILGFANLIADGFSMSVGNYLSVKSDIATERDLTKKPNAKHPFQTAGATFFSFIAMGFIPLLVYVLNYLTVINADHLFLVSCGLTLFAFLFIGFLRSFVTKTSRFKSVAETLFLGGVASILAYYVGSILESMLT